MLGKSITTYLKYYIFCCCLATTGWLPTSNYNHLSLSAVLECNIVGLMGKTRGLIQALSWIPSPPTRSFVPISEVKWNVFKQLAIFFDDHADNEVIIISFPQCTSKKLQGKALVLSSRIWNQFEAVADRSIKNNKLLCVRHVIATWNN